MATVAHAVPARAGADRFYAWMAGVCALVAFLGFVPTYWAPLAAGRFQANPVVHVHGVVFFAWCVFFLVQSSLPSAGRTALHRSLGLLGISLATLVAVLGVLVALNTLRMATALGAADAGEAFIIVPLVGIGTFAVLVALAIANVHRPDVHKRLMLSATVAILGAPAARPVLTWMLKLPPGPPPVEINWIQVPCLLILVAAMIHDRRTIGRVHPAYVVTVPAMLFLTWVVMPISETAGWHAIARAFLGLAGHVPG